MIKRVIAAALGVMCLSSCAVGGGVRTDIVTKEYETDYSSVKAEIIELSGLEDEEFEEKFNDGVEDSIDSELVAFDTAAAEIADELKMGNKCVFQTSWDVKYNKNDFLSLVEERYVYMGGAHGETAWLARNIDIAASKEIKLADLFADSGYVNTLNRLITEQVEENKDEYADLWEKPEIKDSNQTDFYIEDGSLVIFYQPYDLSYYARGFVEFHLPLEELQGYMKEEYARLI